MKPGVSVHWNRLPQNQSAEKENVGKKDEISMVEFIDFIKDLMMMTPFLSACLSVPPSILMSMTRDS